MASTQRSIAIKVIKRFGQDVIETLRNNELLDIKLKIAKTEEELIIPCTNKPDPKVLKDFDFTIIEFDFEVRDIGAKSIKEYLMDKIPENLTDLIPSSFDQVGEIIIVEIHENIVKYKHAIGNALLDVYPSSKTVYRKKSAINGITRIRELDHIAGDDEPLTIHKEYGLKLMVNVQEIYFSPRLSTEHNRIATLLDKDEKVLDLFGGCAPFSIHIASLTRSDCISVDINPISQELVLKSINLNPSLKGQITPIVGDSEKVGIDLLSDNKTFDRIIMNHPSDSLRYLSLAFKLLASNGIIHFYLFAPIENHNSFCENLIFKQHLNVKIIDIHVVRQYSPHENHTCISLIKVE